jgi:serine/threonine protein kinase
MKNDEKKKKKPIFGSIRVQKKKEENEYFDEYLFFKLRNKENTEENMFYRRIKKERDNVLKNILEFLKKEGNDKDELDKLIGEIEKGEKGEEGDLFYRILNGKKGIISEEIFNKINKKKEYSNVQIISAFQKIKEGEKKEEEKTEEPTMSLLQAYYIKLWCFNFISFDYPCNDEYLNMIKDKIKSDEKLKKDITNDGSNLEDKLNQLVKDETIILEKGKPLSDSDIKNDLSELRKGDKKDFQKLIQHFIKQLSIGLYLFHHLSLSESLYHNDLKPDNVLIKYDENETDLYKRYINSTIKIVDLDLTRNFDVSQLEKEYYKMMYKENLFFYDDPDKEEIYEVGEITFELLTGKTFKSQKLIHKNYEKCIISTKLELSENIIRFLHCTLKTERAYRISCDEAFEHKFLNEDNFNKIDFNEFPCELISEDKEYFYLPLIYRYLNLNKLEMIIQKEDECKVEEF